jgi:hypothetical protein
VISRLVVPAAATIMTGVACSSPLPAPLAAKAALAGRMRAVAIAHRRSFTMPFLSCGNHTGGVRPGERPPEAFRGDTYKRSPFERSEAYLVQGTKSSLICRLGSQ